MEPFHDELSGNIIGDFYDAAVFDVDSQRLLLQHPAGDFDKRFVLQYSASGPYGFYFAGDVSYCCLLYTSRCV